MQYASKGLNLKAENKVHEPFSREELNYLLQELPRDWADMVRVCLYTGGQRLGDVALMKWEQVDFEKGYIRMTSQKTSRKMIKPLILALQQCLVERFNERVNQYIFPIQASQVEAYGGTSHLSTEFTQHLQRLGIIQKGAKGRIRGRRNMSEKSFHSLRSTVATFLHAQGVPVYLAQAIVGHSSTAVHSVYIRFDQEAQRQALEEATRGLLE
jgi:integrase